MMDHRSTSTRRPRRAAPTGHPNRDWARLGLSAWRHAGAVGLALGLAALAAPAPAAEFRLVDGAVVDGVISRVSSLHIALRTESGVQIISRDAIESVALLGDGGRVSGRFKDWRDGYYHLENDQGEVVMPDPAAAVEAGDGGAETPLAVAEAAPDGVAESREPVQQAPAAVTQAPGGGDVSGGAADTAIANVAPATAEDIYSSPQMDRSVDAFQIRSAAPGAPGGPDGVDPQSGTDPQLEALSDHIADMNDDLSSPQLAAGDDASRLAAAVVGVGPPSPVMPKAPPAPPAPPLIAPADEPSAGAGLGRRAAAVAGEIAETAAPIVAEPNVADVPADMGALRVLAAPAAGASRDAPTPPRFEGEAAASDAARPVDDRRDVTAQLRENAPAEAGDDGDAAVRGMLTNLIFGEGDTAPVAAPPAPGDPVIGGADAGSAFAAAGAEAASRGLDANAAGVRGEGPAAETSAAIARGAADVGGARGAGGSAQRGDAKRIDAEAGVPSRSGPRPPPGPPKDPFRRPFEVDFELAMTGASPTLEPAISCAKITELRSPPGALASGRADPTAMLLAAPAEISADLAAALARSWYGAAALDAERDPAPTGDVLASVFQTGDRLIRARRVTAVRVADSAAAVAGLAETRFDIGFLGGPLEPHPEDVLIGFDALVLVAHPDNSTISLTMSDIAGLLNGRMSDWSMIQPTRIGAPTLYLPPAGSSDLQRLMNYVGVRRMNPASARFVPNPTERVQAAQADPNGLALVALSAVAGATPLAIGRSDSAVAPSLDTLRSGAYPMSTPVYLRRAATSPHPAAAAFADYLISPIGQRAVFEAGLAPVAACDPTTCRLSAPGLADARERMAAMSQAAPALTVERDVLIDGQAIASFDFPRGGVSTPESLLQSIETFIAGYASDPERIGRQAVVIARRGPESDTNEAEHLRWAAIYAESLAMALRCAGVRADRVVLETSGGAVFEPVESGSMSRIDVVLE